jgi:hypothetical protein
MSESSLIISPNEILGISTNPDQLKLDYTRYPPSKPLAIKTLLSYPIAGATVILMNSELEVSDQFTYVEDLHHPLLKDTKGVSLERLSIKSSASLNSNWHSASAGEEFATPGRLNSQLIPDDFFERVIQIDPEVFDPEGRNGQPFTTIRYQLDLPGSIGVFKIY